MLDSENESEAHDHNGDNLKTDLTNTIINPHRYNYIDLVDRPFCTDKDLQNFITANQ